MVLFTVVVTLSTVLYAFLTALLVLETRHMRKAQTEPQLEVVARSREEFINLVYLRVRNVGLGPAYRLEFEIKRLSGGEGADVLEEDFQESEFLKNGLQYLGPGDEWTSNFTDMRKKFEYKIKSLLEIEVRYRDSARRLKTQQFILDFKEFKGLSTIGRPSIYSMAKSLEAIQKDLGTLTSGFSKLKVHIYTKEDRALERDRSFADRRELKAELREKKGENDS